MSNIIVSYDDNDGDLGDYFEQSYQHLYNFFFALGNITQHSLNGLESTEENVIQLIASLNGQKFTFVGISHGNDCQLLTDNDCFVDADILEHFENSFFYSTACCTAIELGVKIIENGCYSYVGCNQTTFATFEDYYEIYIECENYCLKNFFSSKVTLKEAFQNMMKHFDDKIDELLQLHDNEILVAMELIGNKDSFVLYGNEQLIADDLE
jgi:hypothetical protein